MGALLEVRGLCVDYRASDRTKLRALDGLSFEIAASEVVGLLGESGCGKTTTGLAILSLLPPSAEVHGSIRFRGREVLGLSESELESIRGGEISLIFQEPRAALNPVMCVGHQVAEVILAHRCASARRRSQAAAAMLERVGFPRPARIYSAYPHQLSGGQLQRVVIAQALASGPQLVIADEPTASLDGTAQAEVLALLKELQRQLKLAVLLISHNPGILAALADRMLVMYAGRIIETGSPAQVCCNPLHPYTRALLQCVRPALAQDSAGPRKHLPVIPGSPPDPARPEPGCRFEPRCADRKDICRTREPEENIVDRSRSVRCFLYGG